MVAMTRRRKAEGMLPPRPARLLPLPALRRSRTSRAKSTASTRRRRSTGLRQAAWDLVSVHLYLGEAFNLLRGKHDCGEGWERCFRTGDLCFLLGSVLDCLCSYFDLAGMGYTFGVIYVGLTSNLLWLACSLISLGAELYYLETGGRLLLLRTVVGTLYESTRTTLAGVEPDQEFGHLGKHRARRWPGGGYSRFLLQIELCKLLTETGILGEEHSNAILRIFVDSHIRHGKIRRGRDVGSRRAVAVDDGGGSRGGGDRFRRRGGGAAAAWAGGSEAFHRRGFRWCVRGRPILKFKLSKAYVRAAARWWEKWCTLCFYFHLQQRIVSMMNSRPDGNCNDNDALLRAGVAIVMIITKLFTPGIIWYGSMFAIPYSKAEYITNSGTMTSVAASPERRRRLPRGRPPSSSPYGGMIVRPTDSIHLPKDVSRRPRPPPILRPG
ncbi:hypothetical protein ACHAWF_017579 [Thalassiosira exigua]